MKFRYDFEKRNNRSIGSVDKLLAVLDISKEEYDEFKKIDDSLLYTKIKKTKADGSERVVHNPHRLLRKIQRRINKRLFNQGNGKGGLILWPSYLFGSVPNEVYKSVDQEYECSKDYIACASRHCEARSVLKVDISDFFDNVNQGHVFSIFTELLMYPENVAKVFTEFCCYNGRLVQGALTSSFLASAVLHKYEGNLVQRLHWKHLEYTRLVDDITISSKQAEYDFSWAQKLVEDMLFSMDLPINSQKTVALNSLSSPILVHGLRINFKEPRLPANEVGRIRAAVKHLENLAKDSKYRVSRDYRSNFSRCLGRVNKLKRIGHSQGEKLLKRVVKIKPLPSHEDIPKAESFISKIESLYQDHKCEYSYRRLFFKAHEELNVLQRSFGRKAKSLRQRLNKIKPALID